MCAKSRSFGLDNIREGHWLSGARRPAINVAPDGRGRRPFISPGQDTSVGLTSGTFSTRAKLIRLVGRPRTACSIYASDDFSSYPSAGIGEVAGGGVVHAELHFTVAEYYTGDYGGLRAQQSTHGPNGWGVQVHV